MVASVEGRLESALAPVVGRFVEPSRAVRFLEYLAVGATGAVLDVAVTASLLASVHYLLANGAGFLLANTWNFLLNRRITFGDQDGTARRQYPAYLAWHSTTFLVRAAVIVALVESVSVSPLVASVVGIGAASIANFLGAELIFGTSTVSPAALRATAGLQLNRLAHRLYTERVQAALHRTGLYAPLYGGFQRVLGWLYSPDVLTIEVAGAAARVHMADDGEILSNLHTLRKERDMLEDFVASIEPGDVVWDVGANLGVFSVLAAAEADKVVAFEPYPPNAKRLADNSRLSEVEESVRIVANPLGSTVDTVQLGYDRAERGTQTPTTECRDGQRSIPVRQLTGDDLVNGEVADAHLPPYSAPSVIKIDVEGAELDVIHGLQENLAEGECRLIYVEDHSTLWGGDGAVEELRGRLDAFGFEVDVVATSGGQTYFRGVRR